MTKQCYLAIIISLFSSTLNSQNQIGAKEDSVIKGNQILTDARKAIGIEKININSFSLRTKNIYDNKVGGIGEVINEIKVLSPDKIYKASNRKQPFPTKIEYVWNGTAYKAISETELLGERSIINITNSDSAAEKLVSIKDKIEKQKIDKVNSYKKTNPKERFYTEIWQLFFPLTFNQPFEQKLEFRYVGKAKSANRIANVVDVKSQSERSYRLLFDSETNYLLMVIENFTGRGGNNENKYYFSNREMTDNVLIPKQIKVEEKFTPTGKEPRISYVNIDILEFSLNPKFKENMFETK